MYKTRFPPASPSADPSIVRMTEMRGKARGKVAVFPKMTPYEEK